MLEGAHPLCSGRHLALKVIAGGMVLCTALVTIMHQACAAPVSTALPLDGAADRTTTGFDTSTRHAFCHQKRCLILDGSGKTLAAHHGIDYVRSFKHGVAVFHRREGKGAIDSAGNVVLEGPFYEIKPHENGLIEASTLIQSHSGGVTMIEFFNRRGNAVRRFVDAPVGESAVSKYWSGHPAIELCTDDDPACRTLVLDRHGRTRAAFRHFSQSGGSLAIASMDGRRFGLVDRSLAAVGRQDYSYVGSYDAGFFVAAIGDRSTVLNALGAPLTPLDAYRLVSPGPGAHLLRAVAPSGACLHFSREGKRLQIPGTDCLVTDAHATRVGYVILGSPAGEYVANLDGTPRSSAHRADLRPLTRMMVSYWDQQESTVQLMALDGRGILPQRYEALRPFGHGGTLFADELLLAQTAEGWGVIDAHGTWRLPARYRDITPLGVNLVVARQGDDLQILDLHGTAVADPVSFKPRLKRLRDGSEVYALSLRGKWGLMDGDGHWKLPPTFAELEVLNGAVVVHAPDGDGRPVVHLLDVGSGKERLEPAYISIDARNDGLLEAMGADQSLTLLTPDGSVLARLPSSPPQRASGGRRAE